MTGIEKLKMIKPWLRDADCREYIQRYCPSEFGIMKNRKDCSAKYEECTACWGREVVGASEMTSNTEIDIPWEFEYVSRCSIDDCEGNLDEHRERILVHILMSWDRHRYTGKRCYKIRSEQESGYMWEGWVTEEEIREMLEYRVAEG